MHYYKVISIIIFSLLLGTMAASSSADIYRWVDEKGNVHFGDKPGNGEYDVIEQEPSPVKPADPEIIKEETKKEKTAEKEPEKEQTTIDDRAKEEEGDPAEQPEATIEEEKSEPAEIVDPEQAKQDAADKVEKARQKRISDMEALAEELRISREKRETKREKAKEELRLLREGCVTAMERISVLQAKLDHYVSLQPGRRIGVKPDDIKLDTKHQRIAAELKTRRKYVKHNCDNL